MCGQCRGCWLKVQPIPENTKPPNLTGSARFVAFSKVNSSLFHYQQEHHIHDTGPVCAFATENPPIRKTERPTTTTTTKTSNIELKEEKKAKHTLLSVLYLNAWNLVCLHSLTFWDFSWYVFSLLSFVLSFSSSTSTSFHSFGWADEIAKYKCTTQSSTTTIQYWMKWQSNERERAGARVSGASVSNAICESCFFMRSQIHSLKWHTKAQKHRQYTRWQYYTRAHSAAAKQKNKNKRNAWKENRF